MIYIIEQTFVKLFNSKERAGKIIKTITFKRFVIELSDRVDVLSNLLTSINKDLNSCETLKIHLNPRLNM